MKLANPLHHWRQRRRLQVVRRQVERVERYLGTISPSPDRPPVLFFNASTRIHQLSLNAAFSLLTACGLRAEAAPVRLLVCERGLDPCVLGTRPARPHAAPPCAPCLELSSVLFPSQYRIPLRAESQVVGKAAGEVRDRSLDELLNWEQDGLPLGKLCLPALRWALRRHHLLEDPATLILYRRYLSSAAGLAKRVAQVLGETRPSALVVFNGLFFPESVARNVARRMGIRVITHEVGLRPLSAYFSDDEATFRQVRVGAEERLSPAQDSALDEYLADRFRGEFSMAGIRFWDRMRGLPDWLREKAARFGQVVAIFGNVIFDTSQAHANVLFEDMHAWLDSLIPYVRAHADVLFVLRAHPDEDRPGKQSRETLAEWVRQRGLTSQPNLVFLPPGEAVSSYELARIARFVLVYSSSVGLEASILGVPVLCAGRARYSQAGTVEFPSGAAAYHATLRRWLEPAPIPFPEANSRRARVFLHHELFHASIDLSEFLEPDPDLPGMVYFAAFDPDRLRTSDSLRVLRRGILMGDPFPSAVPRSAAQNPEAG